MKPLTLCLAYYDNPGMLARQIAELDALPAHVRTSLTLNVVDDASPRWPAAPVFDAARAAHGLGFEARLFRFRQDVPWNQDAARNLAVAEATTEWVLVTDMDHVSGPILSTIMKTAHDPRTLYTFRRVTAPALTPYKPHPNSYLMTKALYDKAGGYDERFAGVYGTDGMFASRATRAAGAVVELKEALIRYPREVLPDASTTTLVRKSSENDERRRAVSAAIRGTPPQRGLYAWDRVR